MQGVHLAVWMHNYEPWGTLDTEKRKLIFLACKPAHISHVPNHLQYFELCSWLQNRKFKQ